MAQTKSPSSDAVAQNFASQVNVKISILLKTAKALLIGGIGVCVLAFAWASSDDIGNATTTPAISKSQPGSPAANVPQNEEDIIWKGSLNGLTIEWTNKDLYLHLLQGKPKPIFSQLTNHRISRLLKSETLSPACDYLRNFRVLSIVGTLISFEDEWSMQCGSGPSSASLRFTTIDLKKNLNLPLIEDNASPPGNQNNTTPSGLACLTDYFAEKEIHDALLANHSIREALDKLVAPSGLAGLSAVITNDEFVIRIADELFLLPPDYLTRFAFNRLDQNKVHVAVPLSPIAGAAKALRAQLLLELPVPTKLRAALLLANEQKQGFLMEHAERMFPNKTTEFQVELRKPKN